VRLRPPGDAPARITLDGAPIEAVPGETVAAALLAAGVRDFCRGHGDAPRGPFCGMGVCHDCLVTIDGAPSQRACMVKLRDGMAVRRQSTAAVPWPEPTEAAPTPPAVSTCDVLIVGAGPAGLAAALACGPGPTLRIIDERPAPGGQFLKQPLAGAGDRQARAGAALIAAVRAAGIVMDSETTAWGAFRTPDGGLEIGLLGPAGAEVVRPRLLVVATGAYERVAPVPGWTLPGVMTVGAAQTFLRAYGVAPGRRIVVAGNGPLGLRLACELLRAGAEVAAVAEAAPPPWTRPAAAWLCGRAAPRLLAQGARDVALLRRRGVPLLYRHRLVQVQGVDQAQEAVLAPLAAAADRRRPRRIAADAVCVTDGFLPSNALPRLLGCAHRAAPDGPGLAVVRDEVGRTSQPDVLVVGEAGGFGGAHVAMAQGRLAGMAARRLLGLPDLPGGHAARHVLRRHNGFQAGLRRLFAAADPGLSLANDATPLCRCEGVTLGTMRAAITRHGVGDAAMLKRVTRAGMGRCQGRYCAEYIDALLHPGAAACEWRGFAPQVPVRPVPAGALAAEAPEWRGHRRSALPERKPPAAAAPPPAATRIAVIGGGIAGLSTAWFLARAGQEVLVLDRGEPGQEASGGNAGSLHVQLLSFDFATDSAHPHGPAARTLALQRDAAALWTEIEAELGTDLEIRRDGGLMVAESATELAALRRKVALEQACGIAVELLAPAALYALEPALRPGLAGAAFCPQEGKINPLLATQAMLDAARAAGAVVLGRTEVLGVGRERDGFLVRTQSGPVRAGTVVNAAGAWAGRIAAMAGAAIPVHGAPLQMIVTEPAAPALSRLLAHAGRHLTLKQAASGGFIIGGGWWAGLDPLRGHPRPMRDSLAGNLWVACHLLPALARLHVVRSWAAMNIDIDGAPIIGADPRVPGLFHAVGANGFTLGPLLGRITAALVQGHDPGRDIAAFSAGRFAR
jgi:glycine/D-amino acid oxidase-like deaminating enzyme